MTPLSTITEAKQAGCTHIEIICNACNRSRICLLDILARRANIRTLEDVRNTFRCERCGCPPDQVLFLNPDPKLTFFEYGVEVWDLRHRLMEQVAFAAQAFDEAGPAYESVCRRYPNRWVVLRSKTALLRDSYRPEFVFDG